MAALNLTIEVHDTTNDGPPIPDARVNAWVQPALTDSLGLATLDMVILTVEAPGYLGYVDQPNDAPMAAPIVISLQVAPPEPPLPELPEIVTRGHCFRLDDGTPWTAIECSDFALLAHFQQGADITPILAQRAGAGFNLLRVWTAYDIDEIGTFTDIDYSQVPAFVGLCATYGLYVEFTAYTGVNDPAHWARLCEAARQCQPRPLVELVNELDRNADEPDSEGRFFFLEDYERPEGLLASHGSNGSEQCPVRPAWSYETFHTNDANEWQRKVGYNAMEANTGTPDWEPGGVPVLTNENTRYCDKVANTAWAYDAAAGAALLCAGSCFHSESGRTSSLWTGDEADVAEAWALGAASVDLSYQDGLYNHPQELETPDLLRVYQRYFNDARGAWTVEIRK
jgi:hypothetical protein